MSFLLVDLLHGYPAVIERKELFKYTQKKKTNSVAITALMIINTTIVFSVNIVHKTAEHH